MPKDGEIVTMGERTSLKQEIQVVNMYKGIAIIAVVLLHIFSSIKPSPYRIESQFSMYIIFFDQLLRFSVPLFIALSGFALTKKYKDRFNIREFFSRRLFKLLPLYFMWTFFFIIVLWFVPQWKPDREYFSLFEKVFWGRADYQLYFVPMIFQLYLLFPVLLFLLKKNLTVFLLITFGLQLIVLGFIELVKRELIDTTFLITDQQQYILATTWIFYFCFGMLLALGDQLKNKVFSFCMIALCLSSFGFVHFEAITNVQQQIDPIIALRFTRFSVLLFALTSIALGLLHLSQIHQIVPVLFRKWLDFIGRQSYLIFLSHTFFLRIIFSSIEGDFTVIQTFFYLIVFGFLIFVSLKVEKVL